MSVQPVSESFPITDFDEWTQPRPRPDLALIQGGVEDIPVEGGESRQLFDEYRAARTLAETVEKPEGEDLAAIQAATRTWLEYSGVLKMPETQEEMVDYYSTFDRGRVESKIGSLVDYLRLNHSDKVPEAELQATDLFIESTFAMYEDRPGEGRTTMEDADGSFAFVVPARMSRKYAEYGEEVDPVIPAMRYVPNEMRAQLMAGLPPFVIDTYARDETGRRGLLVFAPVYEDIKHDIEGLKGQIDVSVSNVNAAVDFAHRRFGVDVLGLGATLPALTMYGKKITNPHVITTTGHGGTAELIFQTMESGLQAKGKELESIGVLGMGAIGASVAQVVADRYPNTPVNIYDTATGRAEKVAATRPERFNIMEGDAILVKESQVIISAITGRFNAAQMDNMEDKIVVDDAQPGSFEPKSVEELGGNVLWVIGKDSTGETASRSGYDYATMVNPNTDVFGCEAEAASIARYKADLENRLGDALASRITEKVAIKHAVNVQSVRYISALFKRYGIIASEPQAFGEPVELR